MSGPAVRAQVQRTLLLVLGAAVCLWAAGPRAWFPGAFVLVVPGLALQFAVLTQERWSLRGSYLLGALHVGAFSWSLHHVSIGAWLGVALFGGVYTWLIALTVRAVSERLQLVVFAVAVAGACWLRAEAPEIAYPHGQPCHALWRQPWLLGAVQIGGEPLANALLAALGGSTVCVLRGRRRGEGVMRLWLPVMGSVFAFGVAAAAGVPTPNSKPRPTVDVAAIEPGVHPTDPFAGHGAADQQRIYRELFEDRLLRPTQELAGRDRPDPPELVLWPESSVAFPVQHGRDGQLYFAALRGLLDLAPDRRLCLGTELRLPGDGQRALTPVAALVDARGDLIAIHEKQRLVPGGEYVPFLGLMPDFLGDWIRSGLSSAMGGRYPEVRPGRPRPPLETGTGVPFAALVCYDNAFPGPVNDAARRGARFVAVLSNEAWYRGGAERDQLAAITVIRALVAQMPIVRCTTDGLSMAVDRDGSILAELSDAPARTPAARILRLRLPLGDGALPPVVSIHAGFGWLLASALLLGVLHAFIRWVRLRSLGRTTASGARRKS